jgi:hypothetical protein
MRDDLCDDVIGTDSFGFAFEIEDDAVAKGWCGHGVYIFTRDVIAAIEECSAAASG